MTGRRAACLCRPVAGRAALALLAALLVPPSGARAQGEGEAATAERPFVPAEAAARLADAYQLTNADGDRVCPLMLSPKARGKEPPKGAAPAGGFTVEFDRANCAGKILFSGDIAGWVPGPDNSIRFLSGAGHLVAEFTEGAGGNWEALREGDGVYFLVNPRLADTAAAAQPDDLFGLWELAGSAGTASCRLDFTDQMVKPGVYRLVPDAACAPLLGRAMPDRWRLDGGDLVLETADGTALRFASSEDGAFAKVPEDTRPLLLSRAP